MMLPLSQQESQINFSYAPYSRMPQNMVSLKNSFDIYSHPKWFVRGEMGCARLTSHKPFHK